MTAAGVSFSFGWELPFMEWLQHALGPKLSYLFSTLSLFGEAMALLFVIGILYWGLDKKAGYMTAVNVLFAISGASMIKNVVMRLRPYFDDPAITVFRPVEASADLYDISAQGYSFPSIHSSNSAGLFGSLALSSPVQKGSLPVRRLFTVLAVLLPLLVGFSRVVAGVHYPTDVLTGWCWGLLWIFLLPFLRKIIRKEPVFFALILVLILPGLFFCRSNDYFTSTGLLVGILFARPFEERFVRFSNTGKLSAILLRLLGGVLLYLLSNALLKLPFSAALFDGTGRISFLLRFLRYAIISFLAFGVYPFTFRLRFLR